MRTINSMHDFDEVASEILADTNNMVVSTIFTMCPEGETARVLEISTEKKMTEDEANELENCFSFNFWVHYSLIYMHNGTPYYPSTHK